jgi:hypothetical protein
MGQRPSAGRSEEALELPQSWTASGAVVADAPHRLRPAFITIAIAQHSPRVFVEDDEPHAIHPARRGAPVHAITPGIDELPGRRSRSAELRLEAPGHQLGIAGLRISDRLPSGQLEIAVGKLGPLDVRRQSPTRHACFPRRGQRIVAPVNSALCFIVVLAPRIGRAKVEIPRHPCLPCDSHRRIELSVARIRHCANPFSSIG